MPGYSQQQHEAAVTANSASFAEIVIDCRPETEFEWMWRRSNEYADAAMNWMLAGRQVTAEMCAELADLYSHLADQRAVGLTLHARMYAAPVHGITPSFSQGATNE